MPDGAAERVPTAVKYIASLSDGTHLGLEFDDAFLQDTGTPSLLRYLTGEERLQR